MLLLSVRKLIFQNFQQKIQDISSQRRVSSSQIKCLFVYMVAECCVCMFDTQTQTHTHTHTQYNSVHLYNLVCLASVSWPVWESSRRTKLTAVLASLWNSIAWRCEVIGSQISSVAGVTSSASNWFPLWVDDSIWTPVFPIRHRVTVLLYCVLPTAHLTVLLHFSFSSRTSSV